MLILSFSINCLHIPVGLTVLVIFISPIDSTVVIKVVNAFNPSVTEIFMLSQYSASFFGSVASIAREEKYWHNAVKKGKYAVPYVSKVSQIF